MPQDKPPYKLTISLEAYQPEAMQAVLRRLNELSNEYDQVPELKTKVAIESTDEGALVYIRNQLEAFLRHSNEPVECKVTMEAPGVRPISKPRTTPMDSLLEDVPRAPGRKRTDPRTWADDDYQVHEADEGESRRRTSQIGER